VLLRPGLLLEKVEGLLGCLRPLLLKQLRSSSKLSTRNSTQPFRVNKHFRLLRRTCSNRSREVLQ
jgi:hypothetical protein